ncbi:MAG: hypothetical protein K2G03_01190, partial [Bacilli bacterium]|nr:hypothetical protein [Bacilli bacterium]
MQNKRFMQNVTIITLGVIICCMSIMYAIYGTDVNIDGNVTVKSSKWDIHFEGTQQTSETNITDTSKIDPPSSTQTTSLTFGVNLEVGDVYEFTTDVKNAGTFNAKIASVALSGTKDAEETATTDLAFANKYLKYTVTYADGNAISENDTLDAGKSKKIKVRVEYVQPDNASDLPTAQEE